MSIIDRAKNKGWGFDFWAGGPTKTGDTMGSNNVLDPLGLFSDGGIFGGPTEHPADKAQAAFLAHMMGREGELYPVLKDLLSKSEGNANDAYTAATGEAKNLYPMAQRAISDREMDPATTEALNKIYMDRVGGIDQSANDLVNSKIAALSGSGLTSSDTVSGALRESDIGMDPAYRQAGQDYMQSKLDLPAQVAMAKYGMGSQYGGFMSDALRNKYRDVLDPYLSMWKTSAGLGSSPPSDTGQTGSAAAIKGIADLAGSYYKSNKPKPKPTTTTEGTTP